MKLRTAELGTPIGAIRVALKGEALVAATFGPDGWEASLRWLGRRFGAIELAEERDPEGVIGRFEAYFGGAIGALDAIVTDAGGTPFQARVWAALRRVPTGTTVSYGELGRAIGLAPGASRAVGAANGANPVCLVIPCHRVIGADGTLTGYAAGLGRKRWLLEHEGSGTRPLSLPEAFA
jgi:methylated-DNA-[protein]-cysteine S-methyltransferase